jgi:hypothetical protein
VAQGCFPRHRLGPVFTLSVVLVPCPYVVRVVDPRLRVLEQPPAPQRGARELGVENLGGRLSVRNRESFFRSSVRQLIPAAVCTRDAPREDVTPCAVRFDLPHLDAAADLVPLVPYQPPQIRGLAAGSGALLLALRESVDHEGVVDVDY